MTIEAAPVADFSVDSVTKAAHNMKALRGKLNPLNRDDRLSWQNRGNIDVMTQVGQCQNAMQHDCSIII